MRSAQSRGLNAVLPLNSSNEKIALGDTPYWPPSPKKTRLRLLGADTRRRRYNAILEWRLRDRRQRHEDVVADDRQVALEDVLVVGIEAAIGDERIFTVL